jgi:hypothetical protein
LLSSTLKESKKFSTSFYGSNIRDFLSLLLRTMWKDMPADKCQHTSTRCARPFSMLREGLRAGVTVPNARGIGCFATVPQGDNVRVATNGRGVQGRVVSDLSPVPFPNPTRGRCGKGCLLTMVNALRELQSTGGEELSALDGAFKSKPWPRKSI